MHGFKFPPDDVFFTHNFSLPLSHFHENFHRITMNTLLVIESKITFFLILQSNTVVVIKLAYTYPTLAYMLKAEN